MSALRHRIKLGVAGLFALSGVTHIVRPKFFRPLMPTSIPHPAEVIYVTGAAELACSYGLITGKRWAGPASAVVLAVVWPGNLAHARGLTEKNGLKSWQAAFGWARMPLQVPMIWAVLEPEDSAQVGFSSSAARSRLDGRSRSD